MGQETSKGLKWSLRMLSAMSAVIGIGFIIWSVVIQNPPKSALPMWVLFRLVIACIPKHLSSLDLYLFKPILILLNLYSGLVVLGSVALIMAVVGIFHSMCGRCCLSIFLFFMCLLTLGEFAIIISLFANLDGTVQNLLDYDISQEAAAKEDNKNKDKDKDDNKDNNKDRRLYVFSTQFTSVLFFLSSPYINKLHNYSLLSRRFAPLTSDQVAKQEQLTSDLEIGRYVFLVFIILQFILLLVTIVMRVKFPYANENEDVEGQKDARSAMAQIQMESLKNSVSRNKTATSPAPAEGLYTTSNKQNKSLTKRISQKYGEFTQDPAYQKKWWQGIPGFK